MSLSGTFATSLSNKVLGNSTQKWNISLMATVRSQLHFWHSAYSATLQGLQIGLIDA